MDPQQILDSFYLGDFEFVNEHIEDVEDESLCEEKENIKKLLNSGDEEVALIRRILDIRTRPEDRRKAWVELRSHNSALAEAYYALGMCNLEGDLVKGPEEMTEFSYTLDKLNCFQSPAARTLRMLYLIAGGREDLVPSEFSKISLLGDSGIPEIAQVWCQFVRGAYQDALLSCDDAEDYLGVKAQGRTSTKHMNSLRAVCALHAGEYEEVAKLVDYDNVADLINLASSQANLESEELEATLALIAKQLPETHSFIQPLLELESL